MNLCRGGACGWALPEDLDVSLGRDPAAAAVHVIAVRLRCPICKTAYRIELGSAHPPERDDPS